MAPEIAAPVRQQSATAVKVEKKKKKKLKKSKSHSGGNPSSGGQELTFSKHSQRASSSGAHDSFASGDLLMNGTPDLNQGETHMKRKTNQNQKH
jgi:hypothetical protein